MNSAVGIPDANIKEVDEAIKVEEKKKTQRENLKRYFYTLVTNAKKTIGQKHLGYYVETMLLFNEAIKEQKSVDDWPGFIMNELNSNPTKWIDSRKLNKIKELYFLFYLS